MISNVNESGETDESGSIVHIRLLKFSGETTDEWNKNIIEILKNPNITSVILDLRNNPGGFLQSSVDIASDFLELGSIVVVEENSNGEKNEFKTEKIGKLTNMKIVILINEGSASASEILAGALRDQAGLTLVGETSFGKGTIQEPIQVNGNSGLHITVARWLTPSGYWVNEVGLVPDFEISDDPETEQDEQLLKAIEVLVN
jgi:carboxyl-terminal processing protease